MKKTQASVTQGGSAMARYQEVIVGHPSLWALVYYEWCMFLSVIPGAAGLFLRRMFWPSLFGSCGKRVAFASNIILRNPGRIHLGDRVVISEGCILDARNDQAVQAIKLHEDVILSNNVMLSCKNGYVEIGARAGINAQTIIQSTNGSPVIIGTDVLIGPMCYIVGGGNYHMDRVDVPLSQQGIKQTQGVLLENDIWLGANVSVLDGVTMRTGSIAAAGAVVTKSIPQGAVCAGVPAKIIKTRGS